MRHASNCVAAEGLALARPGPNDRDGGSRAMEGSVASSSSFRPVVGQRSRSLAAGLAVCGLSLALAGCGPSGFGLGGGPGTPNSDADLSAPTSPVQSMPLEGSNPNQIGNGPVKVALIIPLTSGGNPSPVGQSLRNAAEMAVTDSGSTEISVLVKDDQSTPAGARAAAQAAIGEGAEAIVGPLFAGNVREVGSIARSAGKPVIGFSTDTSVATRGVYLLSFLVESYVDRVIDFAAARGKRSFAALIPNNDYGRVAEAEFQVAVARNNARVVAIEHYQSGSATPAVQKIAANAGQIDALFIPEQADAMAALAPALTGAGLDSKHVQILGTGLWNDARVLKISSLQGAWFAAPDNAGFNSFATRYREKYGADPTRIATLAYDAVSLTAALSRQQGSQRFAESVLQNTSGFNGADGVFRFRADGQHERGLAVFSVNSGTTTVVSPAPRNFSANPPGGT